MYVRGLWELRVSDYLGVFSYCFLFGLRTPYLSSSHFSIVIVKVRPSEVSEGECTETVYEKDLPFCPIEKSR